MLHIYYSKKTKHSYVIPNHYSHSLSTIDSLLENMDQTGLTLPTDRTKIKIEVLRGSRHKRQISIEFESDTAPTVDYYDIDKYPSYAECLVY